MTIQGHVNFVKLVIFHVLPCFVVIVFYLVTMVIFWLKKKKGTKFVKLIDT